MAKVTTKRTVADIVVEKLIDKIEKEGKLPWQKPFISPCMNWYSKTEYRGINKILLDGGEYITPNQLKKYNEANATNYWFEKGTPYEIVVFYTKTDKKLSDDEVATIKEKGIPSSLIGKIVEDEEGNVCKRNWILKYYRVYNISYIKDKEGNKLPSKLGVTVVEKHTDADKIVSKYCKASGVGLCDNGGGKAYYTEKDDNVHLPLMSYFKNTEAYYRVLFHELIHSTGVNSRLARQCFEKYSKDLETRGREELIAEMGGLLLASEAGFREDTELAENSLVYAKDWVSWMKGNPQEVLTGMLQAEKAKDYILSGCVIDNDMTSGTGVSIDSGKGVSGDE